EVARFVGADTIVSGVVRERRGDLCVVALGNGEIEVASPAAAGEQLLICLRPEDVVIARASAPRAADSMRNALLGKVRRVIPLGVMVRIDGDAGFELRAPISKQPGSDLHLVE